MVDYSLKAIELFFENRYLDDESFELSKGVIINNKKKFVESHIQILKANTKNRRFMSYYFRLKSFYIHELNLDQNGR